jgi:hypothetical protein
LNLIFSVSQCCVMWYRSMYQWYRVCLMKYSTVFQIK